MAKSKAIEILSDSDKESDSASFIDDDQASEHSIDSDDPDGEPTRKRKPPPPAKPAPAAKKAKVTKNKKGDNDGKNTRVVAKAASAFPKPTTVTDVDYILPGTLDFLRDLAIPANNDREWFKARDNIYRHAEQNWKFFLSKLMPVVIRADWTIPSMPVKDIVGRIYRDVRFSNDKRPYKANFTGSITRTGRKGIFAGYFLQIAANNSSMVAAGSWEVGSPELATIRQAILADPKPLRKVLAEKEFVKLFGEPKAKPGERSSVFGRDDELKTKPKLEGVTKDHPDIDLLKLKSFAVSKRLSDEQVLDKNFQAELFKIFKIMSPFVQCLNEMILPTPADSSEDEQEPVAGPSKGKDVEIEIASDSGEEIPVESSDEEPGEED